MLGEHYHITEAVTMQWQLWNIPLALLAQITRTREAAFFVASMRVDDQSKFWDEGRYFPLPLEKANDFAVEYYNRELQALQVAYADLVKGGVPKELARGVMPQHATTRCTMVINLRGFQKMMGTRHCLLAQGDYWNNMLKDFENETIRYLGPEVSERIFAPPCVTESRCIMREDAEARIRGEIAYEPCRLYDRFFVKTGQRGEYGSSGHGDVYKNWRDKVQP